MKCDGYGSIWFKAKLKAQFVFSFHHVITSSNTKLQLKTSYSDAQILGHMHPSLDSLKPDEGGVMAQIELV